MSVVLTSRYDRQTYMTLCGVMLGHVLLIWSMTFLQTDQFVETHSPENAIKIRFVRMNKTETVQESRTDTATDSTQSQMQAVTQQQNAKTPISKQKQSKVIQSSESKKVIMDQPKQNTQRATLTKTTDQSSNNSTASNQQQSMQTQTKTDLNTSKQQSSSGQSNEQTQKSGGEEGRENKKEQSAESAPKPQQPIMVSKVDVLSFGKLNYDDRELQNQQRLLVLTIKINPQGQAIDVKVKQSTGLSSLDARGVQAAQKTKFKPHILNGEAVAIVVDFPIQLKLGRNR
ncbi:TonB family protein [Acinetobacter bereziniae]|uniref:TonB family protein n=1 Tax=Acinetobacter bereziniae TaxID=106648 RepID=A0A8I1AMT5_ACIBZ|nr:MULTISPECIES: TonB family protein [Acinetobacter]MEC8122473.1 TonB family protein [Pseudomonadota bacterium]MBJ8423253.1 TonB family protein [Acinetobacter bereziniae]MBJ9947870.1 TonB family protein [Acinetobacter bereziniae]MCU4473630.1 TonB family protein [Acinetobacter bereziniae]MCU4541387.1 TonB family protein [Acinetobacter bereziniae]